MGWNAFVGTIKGCYATGDAAGIVTAGGLVGMNSSSATISASYAIGNVTVTAKDAYWSGFQEASDGFVGGLVGENSLIGGKSVLVDDPDPEDLPGHADYSPVHDPDHADYDPDHADYDSERDPSHEDYKLRLHHYEHIPGVSNPDVITNSYFDSYESSATQGVGNDDAIIGLGKTTAELQTPTVYGSGADIYAAWNIDVDDGLPVGVDNAEAVGDPTADDPWDFGTSSEYPVLQVDFDVDGSATAYEFDRQGRSAPPLTITGIDPPSGPVGTRVTIRGTGFVAIASNTEVSFSGTMATNVDVIGSTVLVVVVPTGAATGPIEVVVNSGTPVSSSDFTVTIPPTISSISPEMGPVGTSVVIEGQNFSATAEDNVVEFNGVTAATPTGVSETSLTVLVPNNATTGPITVTVDGLKAVFSDDFTVHVVPAQITVLGATADDTQVTLSWTVPLDGGAPITDYEIKSGTTSGALTTAITANVVSDNITNGADAGETASYVVGSLVNGTLYYFQVAAKNSVGTGTYSAEAPATPSGTSPAPVVNGFTPEEGLVGTSVVIEGLNFSTIANENIVKFGGIKAADPTSPSTTSLTVLVPDGAPTGPISVEVNGQTGTSGTDFTVLVPSAPPAPVVGVFTPDRGAPGTSVVIDGLNFSTTPEDNIVRFGGFQAAEPTVASAISLTVEVPANARTGPISVQVNGQTGTSGTDFTVLVPSALPAPVVDGFTPDEGPVGTSVVITGQNFSATANENIVRFGGIKAADPTSPSTTSLTVLVPDGAITGPITVMVSGQTGTSGTTIFTVPNTTPALPAPVISGFTPKEGAPGVSVTITGQNFSATANENIVRFGGIKAADPTSPSAISLTVEVPANAPSGTISVEVDGQTGISEDSFTVLAPSAPPVPEVAGFTPDRGPVGTSVTITGQNFSATANENIVRFGGIKAADPTSPSAISLTVEVPANAPSGTISVEVDGQTGISEDSFTVLIPSAPPAPEVAGFTPDEGSVGTSVTITGQNFSATPADNVVAFNDVDAATPTDVSTTSLTVLVPASATTGPISVTVGDQKGTSDTDFTITSTAQPDDTPFGLDASERIGLYPNPSFGEVRFTGLLSARRYTYKISSLVGQIVLSGELLGGSGVDVSKLLVGQYVLVLRSDNSELLRTRLLIVK